jgi:hypothetical protein
MPKALALSEDALNLRVDPPQAAGTKAVPLPKEKTVPLQIRVRAGEAKAIKRAALDADQTISDFMLA